MRVVVLDDCPMTNVLTVESLGMLPNCVPVDFTSPAEALAYVMGGPEEVGAILTDYEMPGMNGLAFTAAVRQASELAHVPIVMLTSHDERSLRREALAAGVTDFLGKPCDPFEVRARVGNLLALSRANRAQREDAARLAREVADAVAAIEEREREIVSVLMRAVEHRDSETGDHVARVAAYAEMTARALGLPGEECRRIGLASTMHDVGKVSVPDAVLRKPGALTPEERREMEEHAVRGHGILSGSSAPVLRLAAEIALGHHERWDGEGYPRRLRGGEIPLAARIVALADVFDALTSERPYKPAWTLERARAHVAENAGVHFDPAVAEAFLSRWDDVVALCGDRGKAVA